MISQIPNSLWTKDGQDTGLMANVAPVVVQIKDVRIAPEIPQYPLKPEVELGVFPIIECLLQQGILGRTFNTANSPIFPVKKSGGSTPGPASLKVSLSIFSQALHDCLQSFQLKNGSVLIQYVDHLLLCSD